MKKQLLLLLALILLCEVPQALARGRYGGGARYSASRSTYHPRTGATTTRTRSASTYHAGGYSGAYRGGTYTGAYHNGAYATTNGVARRTARRTVRRQVGYRSAYLPTGYSTYYAAGNPYYYYGGDYYARDDDGYVVVQAPMGATLPTLPLGATKVEGKKNLYVSNGVYYRSAYENGGTVYVVSSP